MGSLLYRSYPFQFTQSRFTLLDIQGLERHFGLIERIKLHDDYLISFSTPGSQVHPFLLVLE